MSMWDFEEITRDEQRARYIAAVERQAAAHERIADALGRIADAFAPAAEALDAGPAKPEVSGVTVAED
jgi:hypothetical protein